MCNSNGHDSRTKSRFSFWTCTFLNCRLRMTAGDMSWLKKYFYCSVRSHKITNFYKQLGLNKFVCLLITVVLFHLWWQTCMDKLLRLSFRGGARLYDFSSERIQACPNIRHCRAHECWCSYLWALRRRHTGMDVSRVNSCRNRLHTPVHHVVQCSSSEMDASAGRVVSHGACVCVCRAEGGDW